MGLASKRGKRLARFVKVAVLLAAALFVTAVYIAELGRVNGRSMDPALSDGDRIIFEKLTLRRTGLQRFDIVVFKAPYDPDQVYIKRVVGLPEELVRISQGRLEVNGADVPLPDGVDWGKADFGPVAVPPAHYFCVGDNLGESVDSRVWGFVPRDYCLGRVWLRFWPAGGWRMFGRESASAKGIEDAH
jgi:signal peptidase I